MAWHGMACSCLPYSVQLIIVFEITGVIPCFHEAIITRAPLISFAGRKGKYIYYRTRYPNPLNEMPITIELHLGGAAGYMYQLA